jgi:hypothetical protein
MYLLLHAVRDALEPYRAPGEAATPVDAAWPPSGGAGEGTPSSASVSGSSIGGSEDSRSSSACSLPPSPRAVVPGPIPLAAAEPPPLAGGAAPAVAALPMPLVVCGDFNSLAVKLTPDDYDRVKTFPPGGVQSGVYALVTNGGCGAPLHCCAHTPPTHAHAHTTHTLHTHNTHTTHAHAHTTHTHAHTTHAHAHTTHTLHTQHTHTLRPVITCICDCPCVPSAYAGVLPVEHHEHPRFRDTQVTLGPLVSPLPPLTSAYVRATGKDPELTTKVPEFQGAIDFLFVR